MDRGSSQQSSLSNLLPALEAVRRLKASSAKKPLTELEVQDVVQDRDQDAFFTALGKFGGTLTSLRVSNSLTQSSLESLMVALRKLPALTALDIESNPQLTIVAMAEILSFARHSFTILTLKHPFSNWPSNNLEQELLRILESNQSLGAVYFILFYFILFYFILFYFILFYFILLYVIFLDSNNF
jgi:hypothetical protein